MTLHDYLLFVGASIVLVLVPGPDMIYLLGRCIAQGRRAGAMAAIGFNLGGYAHLTAAVLGLSALIATSVVAFNAVKWLGACYLVYLGITTLKSRAAPLAPATGALLRPMTILWQAFLSDLLNPKVAMFFLALLPQFVDARSAHPSLQILLLGITVNMIALVGNLAVALVSGSVTASLRRNEAVSARLQMLLGATFVALGLKLAVERAG